MKPCRRCGQRLPLSDFYRHSKMADGHLNVCKTCVKARVKSHREANIERIREYDRNRPNREERIAENRRRYYEAVKNDTDRKRVRGYSAAWDKRHPQKYRAHYMVRNAIRAGTLEVEPCVRCGHALNVHAHHEDYSKPLDVTWLCGICHAQRHREINEERRKDTA